MIAKLTRITKKTYQIFFVSFVVFVTLARGPWGRRFIFLHHGF